ncbi:MAG: ribosome rescue protein RqcH [Candidatus Syntrophoarchaeum sp.]|nr:ribosome rescue protein RqcH [Candidatus Syntrophoarchaeum sp.]
MKVAMSNPDMAAVVLELKALIGARVDKSYKHARDMIRIKLRPQGEGYRDLIIATEGRIYLTDYPPESPMLPPSFVMFLRKYTRAARVVDVRQYNFDRVVEIELERRDGRYILLAELFDPGNLMLLDGDYRIMLPLRQMFFRGRVIKRGEIYTYPEGGIDPLEMTADELFEIFIRRSNRDLVRTLAAELKLGNLYAEEVFLRCGVDKNLEASSISREISDLIYQTIHEIFDPIKRGKLKPHIVKKDGEPVDVLPMELVSYEDEAFEKEYFDSFNKALDAYYSKWCLLEGFEKVKIAATQKLGRVERILNQQEKAITKFQEEESLCIQKGELLYANYNLVDEILSAIRGAIEKGYSWQAIEEVIKSGASRGIESASVVKSLDGSKKTVTIDLEGLDLVLDVRSTIEQNAKVYYDRSKVLRSKRNGAKKALEETRIKFEKEKKAKEKATGYVVDTKIPQRRIRKKEHWYDRFRWFKTSDGVLVVGGRDAKTNEELVGKYLEKGDRFFHTAYPGAPVVILKSGKSEPSETDIEQASQFAVSFSNLWKDGLAAGDCYWVDHDQVSKTPEHGEYLPAGSFVIRGERNYRKNIPLSCSIGIEIADETRLLAGPISAIKKWCKYSVSITPGKLGHNEIARQISLKFYSLADLEDKKIVKEVASASKVAHLLPPGGSEITE